jgi:protease-4
MEFDTSSDRPAGASPTDRPAGPAFSQAGPPPYQPFERPRKRSGWRIFWGIILVLSVLGNCLLFLALIGVVGAVFAGSGRLTQETVVQEGSRTHKIAIIDLRGTIDDERTDEVLHHIKAAREDVAVRGIIVRINSPGGTISGSDRIYNEILKYRQETQNPAVAFMEGLAASGGYYAAVACNRIIAEPTTITGSIGVVMSYFVVENLLENKLGVHPVFLTEGEKKDWPSPFRTPEANELAYIRQRLLTPAYQRFVSVVQAGRGFSADKVARLADGSIYEAGQALQEGLIDEIGYLDKAMAEAQSLARIRGARVIEYHRPFSFRDLLGVEGSTAIKFDRMRLYELCAPQALYLWNAY